MTGKQASEAVAVLAAAFPAMSLEPPSVALFTSEIALLHDGDLAMEASRTIARSGDRFPTIKEFRQTYHACVARRRAGQSSLPEHGLSREVPEWVSVWWWLRKARHDYRVLPQQDGWSLSDDRVTRDEYDGLRGEWVEDGAPKVKNVNELAKGVVR